ncbi:MAG: hypothetical protein LKF36_12005 [Lactobacillus sp.]|jgi:chromosome segregation ATPase|nr:hypothetical protein [Lactobacillus sp.]
MSNEAWVLVGVLVTTAGGIWGTYLTSRSNRKSAEIESLPSLAAQLTNALSEAKTANTRINELEREVLSLKAQNEELTKLLEQLKNGGN